MSEKHEIKPYLRKKKYGKRKSVWVKGHTRKKKKSRFTTNSDK